VGVALFGTLLLVSALSLGTSVPVAGEGTVQAAGTAPNYFFAHNSSGQSYESTQTSPFIDPVNHLLFEANPGAGMCPSLAVMDVDTFAVLATNGRSNAGQCASTATFDVPAGVGGSQPPTVAVDSTDGVLLGATTILNAIQGNQLAVLSERTLDKIATWSLPSTVSENYITGLSWYAPLDELIVLSSHGNTAQSGGIVPPGISVTAYDVKQSLAQGKLVPTWTALEVSGCQFSLIPSYGTAAPYHAAHDSAVFAPCQLSHVGPSGAAAVERDGVIRIGLTTHGCSGGAPECTNGTFTSATAPGQADDVYFDAGLDRAFMPFHAGNGVSALIYDGKDAQFEGQTSLGALDQCPNTQPFGSQIGIDTTSGRVYTVTSSGLISIEGRQTPLSPGEVFPHYQSVVPNGSTAILPPDLRYPYTRIMVSHVVNFCSQQQAAEPDFLVYADTRPVYHLPSATQIDQNTYQGVLPPGAPVSVTYGATGRAYGAHLDVVSSTNGPVNNLLQPNNVSGVPFGAGNRDLLIGDMAGLSLNNGTAQGSAAAVGDGNATTAAQFTMCTNVNAARNCAQPPQPPCSFFAGLNQPCPSAPDVPLPSSGTTAPPPRTSQLWPSPLASCSYPGSGGSSAHFDGLYVTSYSQSGQSSQPNEPPQPTQSTASGTNDLAHADVNCVGDPSQASSISAHAFARGVDSAAGLGVTLASAASNGQVTPPTAATHTVKTSITASAKGLRVVDANGNDLLRIGEIDQSATTQAGGVAGSAAVTRAVTMRDVFINGSQVCASPCDIKQVLTQINGAFPTLIHASWPDPATPYGVDANGVPLGSPGGYTAMVATNATQLYGDEQFNGMSVEEASVLPALRIVLYGFRDGAPNETRTVLDLAGVETDAELGVQPAGETVAQPPIDVAQASADAGVLGAAPSVPGYIPPVPPVVTPSPAAGTGGGATGPLGLLVRAFHGLDWLARSPLAAVQMAAFLALLGLPLVMMRRRGAATEGEDS
jgi:hypothetical protein